VILASMRGWSAARASGVLLEAALGALAALCIEMIALLGGGVHPNSTGVLPCPKQASKSILEGLDEILTVSRLGLPAELRRSLACTNIIENMMGTVRLVTRNVKRWSSPLMALRWTAAAIYEAKKGFRRLKAFKQLPALRAALAAHYEKETDNYAIARNAKATLFTAALASQSSTEHGAIPKPERDKPYGRKPERRKP
jgi:hypothetical protein